MTQPTVSLLSGLIVTLRCRDRPGVLAAVTGAIHAFGGNIREASHYGDVETGVSFIRIHLTLATGIDPTSVFGDFGRIFAAQAIDWHWREVDRKQRVLIAVSRQAHCVIDLLHRWHTGQLHADIVGVLSNHESARSLTEWYGLPFHYLPVTADNRSQQEAAILDVMAEHRVDLLVLARYMQVLSDDMTRKLEGRCINIHHSFLPGFKGARPYHQAHERGVKLIGATAHYVTPDLDEGPIIEQSVQRVTHATSAEQMVHIGQEIEAGVLARAVRWHVEHRVMLNGNKTVVFA